jgi:hypothetical protein
LLKGKASVLLKGEASVLLDGEASEVWEWPLMTGFDLPFIFIRDELHLKSANLTFER